jgi:uncharacterized delta-60 repeat protein
MPAFLRSSLWLLALVLGPRLLPAQVLDPAFHIPEIYRAAQVNDAAQQPDGSYVVAGTFTRANDQAANILARFDAAGTLDLGFQQNLSMATVRATKVYPLANGQLLVTGDYRAGAVERRHLFRLNADGTLDPTLTLTFPGPYLYPIVAQALVQPDGRILILGYFTSSNAEIYRLLPDGSRDPSFSVALLTGSQDTKMLLLPDGKLILGGDFTWVNGVRNFFIARLNPDGSTDTSYQPGAYTNARLYINAIALDASGALVVGGPTANVVGGQHRSVFRLLPSGALDPSFALDASLLARNCNRLAVQPGGQVAALFDAYATTASGTVPYPFSSQLVRLLPGGTLDASFQPGSGPDGPLTDIRSQPDGQLLAWGGIQNFAGQRRTLALLQPSGTLNPRFAPLLQVPGEVAKLQRQADGSLVVVGNFNTIDGHLTDYVARLLPTGQPDRTFAWRNPASTTLAISALATQADGRILLAGTVYTNGSGSGNQPFFTRLTTTGAPDASFAPAIAPSPAQPMDIRLVAELASGQLLVGGNFVDAAGRANLTRLTPMGSIDATFTPRASQPAITSGLVQADGAIVCVVPVPGATYPGSQTIERLLPSGQPDPSFSYTLPTAYTLPSATAEVQAVFAGPATGGYVVSGVFGADQVLTRTTATGAPVAGFAAPFWPFAGPADVFSGINTVETQPNGRLLVGGTLHQSGAYNAPIFSLARLGNDGQLDPTFSTSFITNPLPATNVYNSYSVNTLLTQPDGTTLVGGYFLAAGGQPATGLVRLLAPIALAVGAPRRSSASVQAWPIPTHDRLHLVLAPAARPQQVALLNTMGQTVLSQAVLQPELVLDTSSLAPGFYLLRVAYADGVATRSVVIE